MSELSSKGASVVTRERHREALAKLPVDFDAHQSDAARGLIARPTEAEIRGDDGHLVWRFDLTGGDVHAPAPDTVHPSLWAHSQIDAGAGLYEVADGVYQVRGYDVSNMTLIEGEHGVIVVDTLIAIETAAAALALYRAHRGERPVTAVVISHSHSDHFGGIQGVVEPERVAAGEVPVVVPEGFVQHAVGEYVIAGGAMIRRAQYMFGTGLELGPQGRISAGIAPTTAVGRMSMIEPTQEVTRTGEELTLDGVRFSFQLTPQTEAPSSLTFLLPDRRALYIADMTLQTQHNLLTPRGAQVRDGLAWSKYLGEALELFGPGSDVLFGGHQWPVWGTDAVMTFLARQRDSYRYVHDQAVRLMNGGAVPAEIAEQLELPAELRELAAFRPYYGDLGFNARAVYQWYLGAYDANPVNLDPYGPEREGVRYLAAIGGAARTLELARQAFASGDERWAAKLASHVVFAGAESVEEAKELLADVLEQLGYQAENATWRNIYLAGAKELREGIAAGGRRDNTAVVRALDFGRLLDTLAIRLDGPRAAGAQIAIQIDLTDSGERWLLRVQRGAFSTVVGGGQGPVDATLRLARTTFNQLVLRETTPAQALSAGALELDGDGTKVVELFGLLTVAEPGFPIVTP